MATEVTRITRQHLRLFDEQARALADWHASGRDLPWLHFTASVEESMALNNIRSGAIIISASGMCDAGRIRHHLRHNLPRRECSRSEEHTSELQSLMRHSYAVFCLKKQKL